MNLNCCLLEGGGGSNESVPAGLFPLGSVLYQPQTGGFFILRVATVSLPFGYSRMDTFLFYAAT